MSLMPTHTWNLKQSTGLIVAEAIRWFFSIVDSKWRKNSCASCGKTKQVQYTVVYCDIL